MGVITRVQLLGVTAPLKFGGAKNVQKSVQFTTTFELTANISGIDEYSDKI